MLCRLCQVIHKTKNEVANEVAYVKYSLCNAKTALSVAAAGCFKLKTKTVITIASTASKNAVNRRSEEHTSELQSRFDLVCRLLLEKKKRETSAKGRKI